MATETEKLVLEVVNAQQYQMLTTQLQAAMVAYEGMVLAAKSSGQTNAQVAASTSTQAQKIIELRKEIAKLEGGLRNTRGVGLNFAYALQDVTSVSNNLSQQIMAVSNNLQMMAVSAGLSTKWIIGLTVGVAVLQEVARNWDKIKEAVTGTATEWSKSVDGMKKRLEELKNQKVKIGVDYMEIEALENKIKSIEGAIRAVNELEKKQTEQGKATAKAFEDAFVDAVDAAGKRLSGADITKSMIAALIPDAAKFSEPLQKVIKENTEQIEFYKDRINEVMKAPFPSQSEISKLNAKIETFASKIRSAQAEITRKGGLAEQLLGEKMEQAKTGTPEQQKAAVEFLAQRAAKIPEVQARIKELPALGEIESSQARAQKQIQQAVELQQDHIKKAQIAEEQNNKALEKEHWEAAEREGANAQKLFSEFEAINNKRKGELTERSRRTTEIEKNKLMEMAREADERPIIAQGELQRKRNAIINTEREKRQAELLDTITRDKEFERTVLDLATEAEKQGLKGDKAVDFIQNRIYHILMNRIKDIEKGVPEQLRVGGEGLFVLGRAGELAKPATKEMEADRIKTTQKVNKQFQDQMKQLDDAHKKLLEGAEAAVGPDVAAGFRTRLADIKISGMNAPARKQALDELTQEVFQTVREAAVAQGAGGREAGNMARMMIKSIQMQADQARINAIAGIQADIDDEMRNAKLERRQPRQFVRGRALEEEIGRRVAGQFAGGVVPEQPAEAANPVGGAVPPPVIPQAPGKGFKSVPPQANAEPNAAAPNVAIAAMDSTLKTQAAIGSTNSAISALAARISQSEINLARLATQSRMNMTASTQHQASALDFGANTA